MSPRLLSALIGVTWIALGIYWVFAATLLLGFAPWQVAAPAFVLAGVVCSLGTLMILRVSPMAFLVSTIGATLLTASHIIAEALGVGNPIPSDQTVTLLYPFAVAVVSGLAAWRLWGRAES